MTGGGIVHGPKPRDYSQRTPKKMIAAALLGALSDRARGERLHVVESLRHRGRALDQGRRRAPRRASRTSKNVLVVLERDDEVSSRACATSRTCTCCRSTSSTPTTCSSRDDIVFTKAAYDAFVAVEDRRQAEEVSA